MADGNHHELPHRGDQAGKDDFDAALGHGGGECLQLHGKPGRVDYLKGELPLDDGEVGQEGDVEQVQQVEWLHMEQLGVVPSHDGLYALPGGEGGVYRLDEILPESGGEQHRHDLGRREHAHEQALLEE